MTNLSECRGLKFERHISGILYYYIDHVNSLYNPAKPASFCAVSQINRIRSFFPTVQPTKFCGTNREKQEKGKTHNNLVTHLLSNTSLKHPLLIIEHSVLRGKSLPRY